MSSYIIDASAWVEYFDGTELGRKVKEIVENSNNDIHTTIITIAEVASHFTRRGYDFHEAKRVMISLSTIDYFTVDTAEETGILYAHLRKEREKISLADIFVLVNAQKINAKVLTKDKDFKGFKEALLL